MPKRPPSYHVPLHLHSPVHYSAGWKGLVFTSELNFVYISISTMDNLFVARCTAWLELFPHSVDLTQSVIDILETNSTLLFLQWLKYSARHTTVFAVTTCVQSPCYSRSHQKYCSVMRGRQVQRQFVSNSLST